MTEAQLDAMLERRQEHYRRTAGLISATFFNANPFRGKDSKHITPDMFFPMPGAKSVRQQSEDEMVAVLTAVMGCGPGNRGTYDPKTRTVH